MTGTDIRPQGGKELAHRTIKYRRPLLSSQILFPTSAFLTNFILSHLLFSGVLWLQYSVYTKTQLIFPPLSMLGKHLIVIKNSSLQIFLYTDKQEAVTWIDSHCLGNWRMKFWVSLKESWVDNMFQTIIETYFYHMPCCLGRWYKYQWLAQWRRFAASIWIPYASHLLWNKASPQYSLTLLGGMTYQQNEQWNCSEAIFITETREELNLMEFKIMMRCVSKEQCHRVFTGCSWMWNRKNSRAASQIPALKLLR